MTSKLSFFRIAAEDLRHRMWMLALSCLGSFLTLPVAFLLANRNYIRSFSYNYSAGQFQLAENYIEFFSSEITLFQGAIVILGAIITGICGCRYLYSRKMSDLFHALPIKRSRQFLVCWLNGILLWLIPMVLCVFITLLFMEFNLVSYNITGYMGQILIAALKTIGIWLLAYLTLYHFCLVCAGFSGNAFNAVCSAGLLGIAVISLYGYWDALCGSYFDTFLRPFIRPEQVIWASPLAHAVYIMIYHTNMLFENLQHPVFFLIMTFLMIPANFLAALYLHTRRPSELAERGIQNPVMQHILRICTALLGSLTGLFIFGFITDEAISWMIFGAILFGIFSFGVMNVILNMNFRTFFRHKRELAAVVVFSCIFFLSFVFDWTGYDSNIPRETQIVSSSIRVGRYTDGSYRFTTDREGNVILRNQEADYIPDIRFTDSETVYRLLESLSAHYRDKSLKEGSTVPLDLNGYTGYVVVQAKLRGGSTFLREYRFNEEDVELLRPIVESDSYRDTFYAASCGLLGTPDYISLSDLSGKGYSFSTDKNNQAQIASLMEAYQKDFLANYRLETLDTACEILTIELEFNRANYYYMHLNVYDTYTNTIEVLRDICPGIILTARDLDENFRLQSLTISPDIDSRALAARGIPIPDDLYYSYFGLEGYPDYNDYLNQLGLQSQSAWESAPAGSEAAEVFDAKPVSSSSLHLTIEDPKELQELIPYLYIGSAASPISRSFGQNYISLGYGYYENGSFSCCVKKGELPKKWIDRLLAEGASEEEYED